MQIIKNGLYYNYKHIKNPGENIMKSTQEKIKQKLSDEIQISIDKLKKLADHINTVDLDLSDFQKNSYLQKIETELTRHLKLNNILDKINNQSSLKTLNKIESTKDNLKSIVTNLYHKIQSHQAIKQIVDLNTILSDHEALFKKHKNSFPREIAAQIETNITAISQKINKLVEENLKTAIIIQKLNSLANLTNQVHQKILKHLTPQQPDEQIENNNSNNNNHP